ncbi:hypothetical protein GZH46_02748 [Fragariocoptes setiger]|uniref:Uncharacterized protein n=1 Tax=Fragariocoptes setiger TaxID=1670756 RepID=A0ABQ7S5R3_9ACAR|nr:hypothetical protein GZH46_02748 [Fragariocoptes setiger]
MASTANHALLILLGAIMIAGTCADIMRKSIVFDIKTPKVFYCPQEKPTDANKLIVRSKPLDKLCEYNGKGLPKGKPSDCYNDVDESDYACAEKERIKLRMNPPNDQSLSSTTAIPSPDAPDYIIEKSNKKQTTASKKGKKT